MVQSHCGDAADAGCVLYCSVVLGLGLSKIKKLKADSVADEGPGSMGGVGGDDSNDLDRVLPSVHAGPQGSDGMGTIN